MKKYVAYLIDFTIEYLVTGLFYFFARFFFYTDEYNKGIFMIACAIISLGYLTVYLPHKTNGQTIGMQIFGIRVCSKDGMSLTYFQYFIRELVLKFSFAIFFIVTTLTYHTIFNGLMKKDLSRELPHDTLLKTKIEEI